MFRLTKLSLSQRSVILLLGLLAIGLGWYAASALKQELIPTVQTPQGSVVATYPGASPEVVEAQVTRPIETVLKGVAGVIGTSSTSSSGYSQIVVEWDFGNDPEQMVNKLRSAADSVSDLPPNVDVRVVTGTFDDVPIVMLALSSSNAVAELTTQVNQTVLPQLKTIDGVRDATASGEDKHEIMVTYDPAKFETDGIDPDTVAQLFAISSNAIPSGTMHTGNENLDVQTGTTFASVEQIQKMEIPTTDGPVLLGDVATVTEQPTEVTSISRVNGKSSLTLAVTKELGANTVAVSHDVAAMLPGFERQLGGDASFVTVFDQAPYIEQSIHDLSVEGGVGLAMAVLVILVFLRAIRPTLITAVSIPLSLLIALIGLWTAGNTLNIITLAALTVAIGRVVDDSIVVIENIKRHQSQGESVRASIVAAVKEVAAAVTSSTLTTVAVFLPIGLVGGQTGELFRPFALAVTVSLLGSLLVALTVVPVLASWFMRPTPRQEARIAAQAATPPRDTWLQRAYLPVLRWCLARRWITSGLATALFLATMVSSTLLKTDFIGDMGNESIYLTQKLPAGTSLADTDAAAKQIEAVLAKDPAVQTYTTTVGGGSISWTGGQSEANQASFTVPLKPGSLGSQVVDRIRHAVADLGSSVGAVEVTNGDTSSSMLIYVESVDVESLRTANDQIEGLLHSMPELANIDSDLSEAKEQLSIETKEKSATELGMNQATISQAVARAVRGQLIGSIAAGDDTLQVYLRSDEPVSSVEDLRELKLPATAVMNAKAKSDAAKKVEKKSQQLQDEAADAADEAYRTQVKELKKGRSQAEAAAKKMKSQVAKIGNRLADKQAELQRAQAQAPSETNPAITVQVFALAQEISELGSQLVQLQTAAASSQANAKGVDKQLAALAESRAESLETQTKSEEIAKESKAAAEATADPVALSKVAAVETVQAPVQITTVNGVRTASITASSESDDLGATTVRLQAGIEALDLPDGVEVRLGGVSQQQSESFGQLLLAMLVAVFAVYLIMVGTFASLLQPLMLLVSIPFAATGALGLSLLTDTPIGVPSMIGMLMLIGIVVTNAIVLIDLINQKRRDGLGVSEAIQAGARLRLRPIVMTALATIFALLPMALGLTGGGVFISKPLAIIVIGGLTSSTLLTLILVPVLYDLLETWRQNRADRRQARHGTARAALGEQHPGPEAAELGLDPG